MATKKATKSTKTKKSSLALAADQLIKKAEEGGVEQNFFFVTTLRRYKTQLSTLERLEAILEADDIQGYKEYADGRRVVAQNPTLNDYNKTATAANQTATTLLKIIQTFADGPIMNGNVPDDNDCDL